MRHTLMALILLAAFGLSWALHDIPPRPPRTLIVCIDGINASDFEFMQERGHFGYLQRPGRLISPFPSLTNPAMVEILQAAGAPASPGYEDRFFDLNANRMRGGILKRLGPGFVRGTFRELFDYHPPGFTSGFEYLLPPASCNGMFELDLSCGLAAFRKSKSPVFRIYIGPSDCAAHTGGLNTARGLLKKLDRKLSKLLRKHPETRLILFSDHGNAYGRYRRVSLVKALKQQGYRVGKRIKDDASVVVPRFGLIGAVVVFVSDSQAEPIAISLSEVEGVHFVALKKSSVVHLLRQGRRARILEVEGSLSYQPGAVDPLDLGAPLSLTPERWFEATRSHRYPDPVNRLWEMSSSAVINQAQVVVSLERGYYAGSRALDLFVELRATHGSLDSEQSLGFLASSEVEMPEYLQTRQAGAFLQRSGF